MFKDELIRALRQERQVSGGALARKFGVSRTTVWKAVNELRKKGYEVISSPGLGYSLVKAPELLLPDEISSGLKARVLGSNIVSFESIGSTQDEAKKLARQGAVEGTVVIADRQTQGRGRLDRNWVSPLGVGIYMSIVLTPDLKPPEVMQIPLVAGVAVVRAIRRMTPLKPLIKWPNDVLIQGRKVCGILTEMSAEIDRVSYIVLGIGINVNTPKEMLPPEIREASTSLMEEAGAFVSRPRLVQCLIEELDELYAEFKSAGFAPIRERWKELSCTIGAMARVSGAGDVQEGRVLDLDTDGALLLQTMDGALRRVISGDVSLRTI